MHILLALFVTCFSITLHAENVQRILVLGDSLTEGYGVSKQEAWPALLQEKLQKKNPKIEVVNAGSSGSTTASAYNRLRWHMKKKPDVLILALGGNDGLRGTPVEATQKNLQKAIDMALKKNVIVYLAGMKLPMNYGKEYRSSFEKVFKDLIKKNKIKSIPFLLKGVGGQKSLNLPDGIHPNEKGHKVIAETVYKIIESEI